MRTAQQNFQLDFDKTGMLTPPPDSLLATGLAGKQILLNGGDSTRRNDIMI